MKELISVIMPVYNVEKYLEKSLNTLIEQTYSNIQIICINDGSTDNCPKILQKYKNIDSRIELISRSNKGLLQTRLDGLKKSKGKYIMFVDSDDWFEKNMIEVMYKNLIEYNVDLVRSNFCYDDNRKEKSRNIDKVVHIKESELEPDFYDCFLNTSKCISIWRQLFKRECLKDINTIDTTISMGEDLELNLHIYPNVKSILLIPDVLYHYRTTNTNSITYAYNFEKIKGNIISSTKAYWHLYEGIEKFPIKDKFKYKKLALLKLLKQVGGLFIRLMLSIRDTNKNEVWEFIYEINKSEPFKQVRLNVEKHDITNTKHLKFFQYIYDEDWEKAYKYAVWYGRFKKVESKIKRIG